jgi:hypothetical protein
MEKTIGKTGSAPIKKIGHTFSGNFGSDPNAKVKGRGMEPSDITFGK